MVDTLLDKKGANITLLDIRDQIVFADYFLICDTENARQLRALAESVRQDAKEKGNLIANGIEGKADSGWILVDLGALVVHIFSTEKREFYDLEDLWSEAHVVLHMQYERVSESAYQHKAGLSHISDREYKS